MRITEMFRRVYMRITEMQARHSMFDQNPQNYCDANIADLMVQICDVLCPLRSVHIIVAMKRAFPESASALEVPSQDQVDGSHRYEVPGEVAAGVHAPQAHRVLRRLARQVFRGLAAVELPAERTRSDAHDRLRHLAQRILCSHPVASFA